MPNWRGKRKKRSPWFDLFEEFDRIEEMMEEMMRRMLEASPKGTKTLKPCIYGFSLSPSSKGEPIFQQFGNLQLNRLKPQILEKREPLIDIMDQKDMIVVVAEVPGLEKDGIKLNATKTTLTLSGKKEHRKYFKKLSLPERVNPKSAKTRYKNGVLEVRLKKAKAAPGGEEAIKPE